MGSSKSTSKSSTKIIVPPRRAAGRTTLNRRPPTGGLALLQYRVRLGWRALLETPLLWLTLFLVACTWIFLPQQILLKPNVGAGEIASRTFIADRDLPVVDEAATRSLQERARLDVLPVYDFDRSIEAERRRRLGLLFESGREWMEIAAQAAEEEAERAAQGGPAADSSSPLEEPEDYDPLREMTERLSSAAGFRVSEAAAKVLLAREFSTELEDRLGGVLTRLLGLGVVADKERLLEHRERGITLRELPVGAERTELDLFRFLSYPDAVRLEISRDLQAWSDLRTRERRAVLELVLAGVTPNINYNSSATLELRRSAGTNVGSVTHLFGKGEVVVRKGERIGDLQAGALRQLAGERDLLGVALGALGTLMMLGAAALLVWFAARHERRSDRSCSRLFSECLILLTAHLAGARFASFVAAALASAIAREPFADVGSYLFAIPFAALALLSLLLYGRDLAVVLALVFSLLVGRVPGGEGLWEISVFSLTSCLAAVFALDHLQFRQRSWMTRAAFLVAAVNMVGITVLQLIGQRWQGGWSLYGFDLLCGAAGGLLAAVVASFTVPLCESLFSVTTSIKLVELGNPNLPLLRRLALEAPGTFQHSLAVANLAKAGTEAIDGDSVLAHTGAMYHDIGKMFRPQYFIENQQPGSNPHDKIQPTMSALILINHVKEGIELAEKKALPAPLVDAIEQHHGTRLIKFFYGRAKEREGEKDTGEVREDEFRYPGPKPQSKEMGVLMLADAVEAASRTLVEPSRQKIRSVLRAIFDDCLQDGQLDQTDLTLGDLRKVEDAFQRVLGNIHHRRIEYPGFDFNKRRSGEESGTKDRPPASSSGSSPSIEPPVEAEARVKSAAG
ncbi:MAG: HDIG domain-containing metalloprotein [Acidobacteriota bacterium]